MHSPLDWKAAWIADTGRVVGRSNPEELIGRNPWSVGEGLSEDPSGFVEGGGVGLEELDVLLVVDAW